ncbi:MAG: DUF5667 domain-containing protein [Patescibacteria group bacterium]|nr:DUF5667 domain-containing protein [Patescibacteria group bacterium]
MSKLKIILRLATIFALALTLDLGIALAQDEPAQDESAVIEEVFTDELEAPVVESAAATEDNDLSAEILGVSEPTLLPSSPFYFFKEIGRAVSNTFTFSAEKKAEKRLNQAAERLAEAKAMLSETNSEDSSQNKKIANSLIKYQKDIDKAQASINSVKKDSDAYNNLMAKAVDKYSAFAKVMAADEDLALDIDKDIVREIYKSKEGVLDNLAGVIENLPDPAKLEEVLQNQPGSDFKEFRNLEVLGQLADKLPENAAGAVMQAQERIRAKMEEKLAKATEGKTGEDFANYVIALKGDQAEHMAILDELAKSEDLPDEVVDGFRKAKDAAAINFSKKMINHPAADQMMEEIASGDIDKLRVLEDMADALPDYSEVKSELEAARQKGIDRAVEKMSQINSVDDKINFLIKDGVPDAKSFVILDQLQAEFTPEQQEEVKAVRNKAFQIFSDIVDNAENSDKLLERLSTDSPKDVGLIAVIRQNLPAGMAPKFEQLVNKQLEKVEERLMNEENVEKLISLRAEMDSSPEAQAMMNSVRPGLMDKINKEQMSRVSQAFENAAGPSRVVEIANKYNEILEKYPQVAENINKINPGLVKNLIEVQAKKIEEGISQISDPAQMQATLEKMEAVGMEKFKDQIGTAAKEKITNQIINRQKEVEKNKFMEQMRQETGGELNQAEMEKMFNENVGSLIESSGGRPNAGVKQEIEKVIREKVETTIREQKMQAEIQKQMPGGIPAGGQIQERTESQIREGLPPKENNAPLPLKEINAIRDEAGQGAAGQMQTPPSAGEIERIRQQQMQQQIPQSMGPTPEQIKQMQPGMTQPAPIQQMPR